MSAFVPPSCGARRTALSRSAIFALRSLPLRSALESPTVLVAIPCSTFPYIAVDHAVMRVAGILWTLPSIRVVCVRDSLCIDVIYRDRSVAATAPTRQDSGFLKSHHEQPSFEYGTWVVAAAGGAYEVIRMGRASGFQRKLVAFVGESGAVGSLALGWELGGSESRWRTSQCNRQD